LISTVPTERHEAQRLHDPERALYENLATRDGPYAAPAGAEHSPALNSSDAVVFLVGVGIMIAHNPLHGSGQAGFPHPALALGDNAHAAQGIGMTDGRQRASLRSVGTETVL